MKYQETPTRKAIELVLRRATREVAKWPAWMRSPDVEEARKRLGLKTSELQAPKRKNRASR